MAEFAKDAVIPAMHLAAQLEWLGHAVKGFGFDFKFDGWSGVAASGQK